MTENLVVDADLAVEVDDGAGGHATGRLTADGHRLRLQVDHPEVLAATGGRGLVAGVAAGLAQAGIGAELYGPRGRIAYVDPGRTSRMSALVTGSRHVGIDRAAWPLAARALGGGRAVVSLLGIAAGVTAFVAYRRSR